MGCAAVREERALGEIKHCMVCQWDVFMFTVQVLSVWKMWMRRGEEEWGRGEGSISFLISYFSSFLFFSSSYSFSISLNMKRPAKGGFKYK